MIKQPQKLRKEDSGIIFSQNQKELGESGKLYKYCLRCGRRLKTPEARLRGYGKRCYEKSRNHNSNRLF